MTLSTEQQKQILADAINLPSASLGLRLLPDQEGQPLSPFEKIGNINKID